MADVTTNTSVVKPSWMKDDMYAEWLAFYLDAGGVGVAGSENRATELFRESPNYESYFPGIKTDDGTIRYAQNPEQTYFSNIESFRNTVEGYGLDPDIFDAEYIDLISGDTSTLEFDQRMGAVYNRVMTAGPETMAWYADSLGIEVNEQGMIASLMSDRVQDDVLNRRITMAEIGGSAVRGFGDISQELVTDLVDIGGMDAEEARRFFGNSRRTVATMRQLAARHGDPKDLFNLRDLAEAEGFMPDLDNERGLMDRLEAQEMSTFTGGAQLEYARDRQGGVTGLEVQ